MLHVAGTERSVRSPLVGHPGEPVHLPHHIFMEEWEHPKEPGEQYLQKHDNDQEGFELDENL